MRHNWRSSHGKGGVDGVKRRRIVGGGGEGGGARGPIRVRRPGQPWEGGKRPGGKKGSSTEEGEEGTSAPGLTEKTYLWTGRTPRGGRGKKKGEGAKASTDLFPKKNCTTMRWAARKKRGLRGRGKKKVKKFNLPFLRRERKELLGRGKKKRKKPKKFHPVSGRKAVLTTRGKGRKGF